MQQYETMVKEEASQDSLYEQAAEIYSAALDRLARAYELDREARRDLLQEIHLHLWRSFSRFDQRCSLRLRRPSSTSSQGTTSEVFR